MMTPYTSVGTISAAAFLLNLFHAHEKASPTLSACAPGYPGPAAADTPPEPDNHPAAANNPAAADGAGSHREPAVAAVCIRHREAAAGGNLHREGAAGGNHHREAADTTTRRGWRGRVAPTGRGRRIATTGRRRWRRRWLITHGLPFLSMTLVIGARVDQT